MKIYNSVDAITGLALALEERDLKLLTTISEQIYGWIIPDDEMEAYEKMISAILEEVI